MRPRISKKNVHRGPPTPRSYTPSPSPKRAHVLQKGKIPPLVFLSHGNTLIQDRYLPRLPGQVGFAGDRPQDRIERCAPLADADQITEPQDFEDNPFMLHQQDDSDLVDQTPVSRHRRKREKQWERWQQEVIPMLIGPYMELMCATKSLREPVPHLERACSCGENGRTLEVVLVRFDCLERISIVICSCKPATRQLLERGCFAAAPLAPTLAVDLKVLEFVTSLFVNVAPNNTAWCKTVETFLSKQGYKLSTQDSLRKRFGNALQWYNALQDATTRHVELVLRHVRRLKFDIDDGIDVSDEAATHGRTSPSPRPAPPGDRGHSTPTPHTHMAPPNSQGTDSTVSAASRRRRPTVEDVPDKDVTPTATIRTPTPQRRATVEDVPDEDVTPTATPCTPRRFPRPMVEEVEDEDAAESTPPQPRGSEQRNGGSPGMYTPSDDVRPSASKRSRPIDEQSTSGSPPQPSNPFPDPLPRVRPSDYLRARCPLCFGGKFPRVQSESSGPDAIVCIDACFTQKRNRQARDLPRTHPRTVFIPEQDGDRMEKYVESIRPSKGRPTKWRKEEPEEEEDFFEGPLRVPKSALDGCESGFTAADDRREKASTQFFDDTALMALLCRHDVVLWMVNMRSAGEKQHYTMVLVETLFQHIPLDFTIGLLYDIGCQMHRSCVKWGFLDRYADRLIFGISVFHAFGHQWPCQIIYHPRKRKGFGLTDGEGCERFWHSISKLIAYLRVCGYHQRLYTLDRQVQHAQTEILEKLGRWLLRRSQHTQSKLTTAEAILQDCGHSEGFLRAQWKAQVDAQTKPLPRRSRGHGKVAVEEVIRLRKGRDILKERVQELEGILIDPDAPADIFADAEIGLERARESLLESNRRIQVKERALGINDRDELQRLISNPYIAARMNARALKQRLRDKLRFRKFELDRLERSFRKQVNDKKIHAHTESSVNRREPTIQRLAQDYNRLCGTMAKLIKERKAPRGARCPQKINSKGLFALDVDDEIWQDVGLDDDMPGTEPPPWLSNDRNRLRHECRAMREWFAEEWLTLNVTYDSTDDESLRYEVMLRRTEMCHLCATWQKSVQSLDFGNVDSLPPWGPSSEEILEARIVQGTASVRDSDGDDEWNMESHDDEDDGCFEDDAEDSDYILLETLDAVDLADSFRSVSLDDQTVSIDDSIFL
ncbi:hypothetical protein Hypma_003286 [Hypsizygus marmoreus]|uniref:CxC1-like cysteine cluster associated with KDZ transposases domain-containing protein n=1 Tax=Hypsizygus marmoreus TaxID=39966 RepID=A0A369JZC9_HYPMA|nr:hypothetical protein Hypma_003286 [Hypsizygus marmoreus]